MGASVYSPSQFWDAMWLEPCDKIHVQVLCVFHSLCELMCVSFLALEDTVSLESTVSSGSYIFSPPPLLPIAPGALRVGFDEGTLFRTGCSLQSLSAWCPVMGFCERLTLWKTFIYKCSHSICTGFQLSQSLVGSSESER